VTATLIAEALAAAEREIPRRGGYVVHSDGYVDAALRHLAERAWKAEAERATLLQALRRVRDEFTHARDHGSALYLLHKHTERALRAVGEDPHKASGAYAEKAAPRG
jgi:hypothetical protein